MRFPSTIRRLRNTQGGTRSTRSTPYTPYMPEPPVDPPPVDPPPVDPPPVDPPPVDPPPVDPPPVDPPMPPPAAPGAVPIPPTSPSVPVARITSDQDIVSVGTTVNFDGSASTGRNLTYSWAFGTGAQPATATTPMASCKYTTPGPKIVTLIVTDDRGVDSDPATLTVRVVSIKPQTVNDGERVEFEVLGATDATGFSWRGTAPDGAGNDPEVVFSVDYLNPTTIERAKWFALPNRACGTVDDAPASRSSEYTITCDITFPDGNFTATSTLTVEIPPEWFPAGYVQPGITGAATIVQISEQPNELWKVTGLGNIERSIRTTINVPESSYFHAKVVAHEQKHYEQYDTGMVSSHFSLARLWEDHLKGLEAEMEGILNLSIRHKIQDFLDAVKDAVEDDTTRLEWRMEAEAHAFSDPMVPQYIYQRCGRYRLP